MSDTDRCPLCRRESAAGEFDLCAPCQADYDAAFASKATVGSTLRIIRDLGGSIFFDGVNWTGLNPGSDSGWTAWQGRFDRALSDAHCVGKGRLDLLEKIQRWIHWATLQAYMNAIPTTNPKRPFKLILEIENCQLNTNRSTGVPENPE